MISCATLERPGTWRIAGIALLFGIALLPAVPFLWRGTVGLDPDAPGVGSNFGRALGNSARMALVVAVVALAVGLPAGVLAARYAFPGRRAFLALATLPLL